MHTAHPAGFRLTAAPMRFACRGDMSRCLWGVAIVLGLSISGCVRNTTASYPDSWAPRAAVAPTECPHLAGRYQDAGEMAPATTASLCGGRISMRAEWRCDRSLGSNVADTESAQWVELRQPDADTLVIVSSDPVIEVKELHRSRGDFSCSAQGLERHLHSSLMSMGGNAPSSAPLAVFNGFGTLFNLATAGTAGVRSLTRTFRTAADGALIMDVSQSESGLFLLVPSHWKEESFVRWVPAAGSPVSSEPAVRGSTQTAAMAQLPSAQVARFISMNDFAHHLSVNNVDGATVNQNRREGRPVALSPGKHWVQVRSIDHSFKFRQWRDFDSTYGFELEAIAGHAYRLSERPASCVAPGNLDAALESHRIGRTEVSLIDQAPGQPERRFIAPALCVAGMAATCGPTDSGEVLNGLVCVRLNSSGRGYYGRPAAERLPDTSLTVGTVPTG